MPIYLLPKRPPFNPAPVDRTDLSGEDILFTDRLELGSSDFRTVSGRTASEQSVRRELQANTGSLLRRPDWGVGATQLLLQGVTRSSREALKTRARTRMVKNPRVRRLINVDVTKSSSVSGVELAVSYEPVGVSQPISTVLRAKI